MKKPLSLLFFAFLLFSPLQAFAAFDHYKECYQDFGQVEELCKEKKRTFDSLHSKRPIEARKKRSRVYWQKT